MNTPLDDKTPELVTPRRASRAVAVAVIDIGATSIRMAIGEIDQTGHVRTLETLTQAVNLGKDTFTEGAIRKSTIEECVRVLASYRQVLQEYRIDQPDRIRVVATSAVREARNRLAFIDRVFIATGIEVEPIDEAEVNRVTYLGVQSHLQSEPQLASAQTLIAEVGGGSTEVLLVKSGNVAMAHTFRLGSMRLRQSLASYRASGMKIRKIMENQIRRTAEEVRQQIVREGPLEMIALGGDIRFAAAHVIPDWQPEKLTRLPIGSLEAFTDQVLEMSDDRLVQRYHLSFPEAQTVGPALLTYVQFAKVFELPHLLVTNTNLRDGLLKEMASRHTWTEEFRQQIIRSTLSLGASTILTRRTPATWPNWPPSCSTNCRTNTSFRHGRRSFCTWQPCCTR